MKEIIIDKNHMDMRLDRFALKTLDISKGEVQKGIRTKKIKVNGKKAQNNHHLNEGDIISFYYDKKCFKKDLQSDYTINTKLDILFENRDILIINKKAGILSQSDSSKKESIVEM